MPADLPRVLTVAQAEVLGVGRSGRRHRVARGDWQVLLRGVLLTSPDPPTREDWIVAALGQAGPAAALSGWDAARTYGLGARVPPADVLVLDAHGRNRRLGPVRIRPTGRAFRADVLPAEHPTLALVPVVHAARAVVDAAGQAAGAAAVRALVTGAVQRRLCSAAELHAEAFGRPGDALRRAVRDAADGAQSVAESDALIWLRRGPVPQFELNVPIVTADGRVVAVVDALWRDLRAALEVESREFHFTEQQWRATMSRHNLLSRLGLAVTHYPPSAIRAGNAWVAEVAQWLRGRAAELGVAFRPGGGVLRPGPDGPRPLVVAA